MPDRPLEVTERTVVDLTWGAVTRAQRYDVELNDTLIAEGLAEPSFVLRFGHLHTGLVAGENIVRIRAVNDVGETWGAPARFSAEAADALLVRGFDDDDPTVIESTTPSVGTMLEIGATYAFGSGNGVAVRCLDSQDRRAYRNLPICPVDDCWIRMSIYPSSWDLAGLRTGLGRIRSTVSGATEHLIWTAGEGLRTSSIGATALVRNRKWTQAQMGIRADGTVELWSFDGHQEFLVGRVTRPEFAGVAKDVVSFGNGLTGEGGRFEVWLDDVAVGVGRLPWVQPAARRAPLRPRPIAAAALPASVSFGFGAGISPGYAASDSTALAALGRADPAFFVHLGDHGYPANYAHSQAANGYLAYWSSLLEGRVLRPLSQIPWICLAGESDLGVESGGDGPIAPFAAAAFDTWADNPTSVHPAGRYGAIPLDGGRVVLAWTDGQIGRDADDVNGTYLGAEQEAWLFDLLATTDARLVLIATASPVGHVTKRGWSEYGRAHKALLAAAAGCPVPVRFLSGGRHLARRADFGGDVAEWGAASLASYPHPAPRPAAGTISAGTSAVVTDTASGTGAPRELADAGMVYGHCSIDSAAGQCTIEVRGADGQVRVDDAGQPMSEVIFYEG